MQTIANISKPSQTNLLVRYYHYKIKSSSTIFRSIKSKSQPPVKSVHFSPLPT